MTKSKLTLAALAVAALGGCAAPNSGPVFRSPNSEVQTRLAVLESVRFGTMKKDASNTWQAYAGQAAGAVLGGLVGNQVKSNAFKPIATTGGAIAGAVVTSKIQGAAGEVPAVQLTYTLLGCQGMDCTKTVEQEVDGTQWKKGDRVRVSYGNGARVNPL